MAVRLIDPTRVNVAGAVPTVLVLSGFPWYTSELAVHRYLTDLYPAAPPVTTRLYTNPTNGASRGHCFVEYDLAACGNRSISGGGAAVASLSNAHVGPSGDAGGGDGHKANSSDHENAEDAHLPPLLRAVKRRVEASPYECVYLRVRAYVLTSHGWSRAGRLPELPTDPPPSQWRVRGGVLAGYGDEGFTVRCGGEVGLPNTLTVDGYEKLERLRKRMRSTSTKRGGGGAAGHAAAA